MNARKRPVGRFQVEALEGRWAPGGRGGIGGEVHDVHVRSVSSPQAHVAPLVVYGSNPAAALDGLVACGSNTVRAGEEGN
jgi:hypothetical protein